jgi:hypothetical protein
VESAVQSSQVLRVDRDAAYGRLRAAFSFQALLADGSLRYYFEYHKGFALSFERGMAFVTTSLQIVKQERKEEETVLISLAFMPYTMWELKAYEQAGIVIASEQATLETQATRPDWIVYIPEISANKKTNAFIGHLIAEGGYELRLKDGASGLFRRKT